MVQEAQQWVPHVLFGLNPRWVAATILAVTYVAIMTERINRAIIAGLGACLMIVLGVLDQDAAIRGVDFNTLMLLAGMMLIVGVTRRTGVFEYLAVWSVKRARARPAGVLVGLAAATAVFSALLDNVTTVLLIVPVTISIARELDVPPYPFLAAEIVASNVGGTATLIGDPPNIMIGSAAGLTFNDFLVNLGPIVVLIILVNAVMLHLLWGRGLTTTLRHQQAVLALRERDRITDPRLLRHCLGVLAGVVVAFIFARQIHLHPGTIAMSGAAILFLIDNWPHPAEHQTRRVHAGFSDMEWVTLFFFIGLFVIVAGVERAGLIGDLAGWVVGLVGANLVLAASAILWSSAVLSAFVDNIPYVATMIPLIMAVAPKMPSGHVTVLWWALSLGACLGGNGTLIGASANLTVAGLAERSGIPFRFLRFTKVAFPLMLLNVALVQVYLLLRYL